MRRGFAAAGLACAVVSTTAACGAGPVAPRGVADYRVEGVAVGVSAGAEIDWPTKTVEFAEGRGLRMPGSGGHDEDAWREARAERRIWDRTVESPEARAFYAEALVAALEPPLRDAMADALPGSKPATLEVTVSEADIASGGGRLLAGSASDLVATARLRDADGAVVAEVVDMEVRDRGMRGLGPIGGAVALTVNAVDLASSDLFDKVARDLAEELKRWLSEGAAAPA